MKTTDSPVRDLAALSVICLSVSVGSWMILVAPSRAQEATLQAQRDRLTQEITAQGTIGGDVARWTARLRQTAEATRRLSTISAASATDRGVIERLGAIAEQAGVRIDEMRPQEISTADAAAPGAPQSVAPAVSATGIGRKPSDVRRGVRLVMSGSFEDVTRFFLALDAPSQLAAVRSLRIIADGRPGASAVVAEANLELFSPLVPESGSTPPTALPSQPARTASAGAAPSGADK